MKLERIYLRMTKIYCFQDLIVRRDSKFNLNSGIARHSVIIISLRYQSKLIWKDCGMILSHSKILWYSVSLLNIWITFCSKEKVFMQDDDRSTQNLFNDNFGFIEESPVCDSQESYIYPRTARNKDREWKFVVNVISDGTEEQEDYVQAVKIEKCLRPGEECSVTNTGYQQTVCRQKYSYTKLIAINNDGSHYIDSFRFPSCCLCYQKKVFNDIPFQLLTESNQTIIESSTKTIDGTRKIGSERRNLKKPQLRYTHSKYYRWRQLWGEGVQSLKFYKIIFYI